MWLFWLVAFLIFWLWAYLLRGGSRLGAFSVVGHTRTLSLVALPMLGTGALLLAVPQVPYRNPRLAAVRFEWPRACQERPHRRFDTVTKRCLSSLQPLDSSIAQANGLKDGEKGRANFYRLGNDAAAVSCVPWSQECYVTKVYRDIFVVTK